MASSVPPVPYYAYIVIRIKMAKEVNNLFNNSLFCDYGETNDVFLIGGGLA
jgi:hypothetical protein